MAIFKCVRCVDAPKTEKHKWKRAECDHVQKKQKTSEADSFRNMKVKIPYTLEDGHVGRKM
jgi:hypothetical protein